MIKIIILSLITCNVLANTIPDCPSKFGDILNKQGYVFTYYDNEAKYYWKNNKTGGEYCKVDLITAKQEILQSQIQRCYDEEYWESIANACQKAIGNDICWLHILLDRNRDTKPFTNVPFNANYLNSYRCDNI